MKLSIPLGVMGLWQIIALFVFIGFITGIVLLIVFFARKNAKKRIFTPLNSNQMDQLKRLNELRQSGALSEIEKRKILAKN